MKTNRSRQIVGLAVASWLLAQPPGGWAQAVWNQAIAFRGANDYMRVTATTALDLTNNYTIECWFRADALGGMRGLVSKFHTAGANGYWLRLNGSHLDFDGMTNATVNLLTETWYHVAAVNSNQVRQLFLNGQVIPLAGVATPIQANANPLCLGVDYLSSSNRFFKGQMDEVRLWSTARSQTEIQATMNAALSGSEADLVAYYRFNEPSGVQAYDATSNHLTGTLLNRPMHHPSYWWPSLALNSAEPLHTECHEPFVDPTTVNGPVVAIAVGESRQIALRADGSVAAFPGPDDVPAHVTNIVAIAAGLAYSNPSYLALRADGTIVGWGDNYFGQTTIPASATNVVAIAMGRFHCLALRGDGTVVGWGRNQWQDSGQATVPANATNIVAIAAGGAHSLALKADGTVIGWGENSSGNGQATPPAGLSNVVALAAGIYHSLALKADGTIAGWGDNYYGETTIPASFTNIAAIAAGNYHSLAIMPDGRVIRWGETSGNFWDLTANAVAAGTTWNRYVTLHTDGNVAIWNMGGVWPEYAPATTHQTKLTPAVTGTVDSNAAGSVFPLGYAVTNEMGLTATNHRTVRVVDTRPPVLSLNGDNPILVATGSLFVDPGATASDFCAGDVTAKIVTNNTVNTAVSGLYTNTFVVTDSFTNQAAITRTVVVGGPAVAGLSLSNLMNGQGILTGTVNPNGGRAVQTWFEWGPVRGLQYAHRTPPQQWTGSTNALTLSLAVADLIPGHVYHYRIVASNDLWVTRSPDRWFWIPAVNFHQPALQVVPLGNTWTETTTVDAYPMQLLAGVQWAAGLKADGTVGIINATPGYGNLPADATNLVAFGDGIGLRADGYVAGWGISNVVAIAGAGLALKEDGSVVNRAGTILATNAVAIAEGLTFGLALRRDGTIAAWGGTAYDGEANVPSDATNVVAIAAGWRHGLALRADGTVVAWGANLNNHGEGNVPAAATNVIAIAAGAMHSVALRADSSVLAWGGNTSHQCDIAAVTNVIAIGAGYVDSLALKADGTVRGAGSLFYYYGGPDYTGKAVYRLTPTVTGTVNTNVVGRYALAYAATNAMGGVGTGSRLVAIATRPSVTTEAITGGGATPANLNGTVNPRALETLAWFEYGLLPNYDQRTTNQMSGFGTVSQPFGSPEGLRPWITYHYRAVASNALGHTEGAGLTVTVPGPLTVTPNLSALPDITLPPDSSTSVWFLVSSPAVDVRVTCNNPVLVPDSGLTLSGLETNFNLTITPAKTQSGSAQITVLATSGGAVASRTFTITVTPPAGGVGSWLKLAQTSGTRQQLFSFQIAAAGTNPANYTVEFRPDLNPATDWQAVTNVEIRSLDSERFAVEAVTTGTPAGYYRIQAATGPPPRLLQPVRSVQQSLRFQITDAGTGATNYVVEYRPDFAPTNGWTIATNVTVSPREAGVFQVRATPPASEPTGFYRVKGLRFLSGSLQAESVTTTEGVVPLGTIITFNGIYTGPLVYIWSDEAGHSWTNELQVNGTTAVIPVPATYRRDDDTAGPLTQLALRLPAQSGFNLGATPAGTVMITENDSRWEGVLTLGGSLDFTLTITQTNGGLRGVIQSDGFGFFPTNVLVQLVLTPNKFIAVATNIPLLTLPQYPTLSVTNYLDLRLDATTINSNRMSGVAAMVCRVPANRSLDSGGTGTFTLFQPTIPPATNEVVLQAAP